MSEPTSNEPALDALADEDDTLGWETEKHGRMLDTAVSQENELVTETYVKIDPEA